MKTHISQAKTAAFTMVEIAIALGVIAFALVAIVGILPSGLNVERENREQTLINQDGPYFLEAVRSGAQGLDILTNFVDSITITAYSNGVAMAGWPIIYTNSPGAAAPFNGNMVDSHWIMGLLSHPKYLPIGNVDTNVFYRVDAHVHALSGAAVEQGGVGRDLSFSYSLWADIVPVNFNGFQGDTNRAFSPTPYVSKLQNNLYEVRLNFRWPLLPNGDVGAGRKIYRTYVSGQMTTKTEADGTILYFFRPDNFAMAQ